MVEIMDTKPIWMSTTILSGTAMLTLLLTLISLCMLAFIHEQNKSSLRLVL